MRAPLLLALGVGALFMALGAAAAASAAPAPRPSGDFSITSSRSEVAARPAGAPTRTARAFIDARPALTGASRRGAAIVQESTTKLIGGGTAVRYQQEVDGVPVLGAQTVVSTDAAGRVTGASGERLTGPTPDLGAQVPAATARADARLAVAQRERTSVWALSAGPAEAVVFDPAIVGAPAPFGAYLAWSVEVTDTTSGASYLTMVSARDGGVYLIPRTHSALQRRVCDANAATALVPCTSGAAARVEGGAPTGIADVDAAYDYSGDTYDFFSTVLGRDSIDDAGMPMVSTVRYCSLTACPYRNAFWSSARAQMVYGEGMVSDDVTAHEITHGVTDRTANLLYVYQSGSINEAISDIFGEFVDLWNGAGNDAPSQRWKMGEDIVIGAIRDMANPPLYGDPDSTQSALWSNRVPTDPAWDEGGVHSNSGVGNKAAQLMVDGGTHRGQTVSGIGIEKTAKVFYRALTAGLTSGSNYSDLDAALAQACTDLTGTAGITSTDCLQVQRARLAVSMEQTPLLAPTPTAPVCTTGTRNTILYDDLEDAAVSNANWTAASSSGSVTPGRTTDYAASGTWMLYLPDPSTAVDMNIALRRTDVLLPANAFMRFDHAYLFDATYSPTVLKDGGVVEIRARTAGVWGSWTDAGGLIDSGGAYTGTLSASNALGARQGFGGASLGYGSTRLDLSSYAGKEVQVRFRVGTDASLSNTGWVIDNVHIYSCPGASAAPPGPSPTPTPSPGSSAAPTPALQFAPQANPCAGLSGVALATCTAAGTQATATAAATAALERKVAACEDVPSARRAACRTAARADHTLAIARIGARRTLTVALARCAAGPAAGRTACRTKANKAYRTRVAKAVAARKRVR